jgi:hypothetical protein
MPGHLPRGTCCGVLKYRIYPKEALKETKCQLRGVPFELSSKTEKRVLFDSSKMSLF